METAKRPGPVRRFFRGLGRTFAILIFIGIITGSIVVSVMALYVFNSLEGAPVVDLSNVEVNLNNTSYIYVTDPETQEETVVKELYSGQNREWVSYDEIHENPGRYPGLGASAPSIKKNPQRASTAGCGLLEYNSINLKN